MQSRSIIMGVIHTSIWEQTYQTSQTSRLLLQAPAVKILSIQLPLPWEEEFHPKPSKIPGGIYGLLCASEGALGEQTNDNYKSMRPSTKTMLGAGRKMLSVSLCTRTFLPCVRLLLLWNLRRHVGLWQITSADQANTPCIGGEILKSEEDKMSLYRWFFIGTFLARMKKALFMRRVRSPMVKRCYQRCDSPQVSRARDRESQNSESVSLSIGQCHHFGLTLGTSRLWN